MKRKRRDTPEDTTDQQTHLGELAHDDLGTTSPVQPTGQQPGHDGSARQGYYERAMGRMKSITTPSRRGSIGGLGGGY